MNRLINRSFLLGLAFTMLSACGGSADTGMEMDEEENLGQVEEALASCGAPINGLADWIDATRTGLGPETVSTICGRSAIRPARCCASRSMVG